MAVGPAGCCRAGGPSKIRRTTMQVMASPLCRFVGALALALACLSSAAAQDKPKAAPPVLVTSVGQSLDAFQVQLVARRAGIAYRYDARADTDALAEAKTLFL